MDKRMRSFRLWMPQATPETWRQKQKTIARVNGGMLALASIPMFLLGFWLLATLREATWQAFLLYFVMCGLWLFGGIAAHRWGKRP